MVIVKNTTIISNFDLFFPPFPSQDMVLYENKYDDAFLLTNIWFRIVNECVLNVWIFFKKTRDVSMGKLNKRYKHSTVKKTVLMSLGNYCKRQTTLDNEARTQIATAQASLTKIE